MMRCGFKKNDSADELQAIVRWLCFPLFSGAWPKLLIDPVFDPAVILAPVRCVAPGCGFMFVFFRDHRSVRKPVRFRDGETQ